MNSINHIKKLLSSFFSIALFIGLMAGCTSVTDANIDEPEAATQTEELSSETENDTDDEEIWNSNGDDMDPIVEEPPPPRGS